MKDSNTFQGPLVEPDCPKFPPKLDLYMPATPPIRTLALLEFWVYVLSRRHHFKKLFKPLLQQPDEMLEDIGFSREEINWALQLPLKIDALKALEACRRERARSLKTSQSGVSSKVGSSSSSD